MRRILFVALALASPMPVAAAPLDDFPGTYTNEEEVYFAAETKKAPVDYVAIRITREGTALRLTAIDKFGKPTEPGHVMAVDGDTLVVGDCRMPYRADGDALVAQPRVGPCRNHSIMTRLSPAGIVLAWPDGRTTMLRRARAATCWGAGLKSTRKADGSEDWLGTYNLKLHDQGGRVAFGGGDTGTPPVVLRMRNVVWPSGPNKPSLVLYVHTPDQPDHAVSYAWADPGATRIGINLRWMQASCSIDTPKGGQ